MFEPRRQLRVAAIAAATISGVGITLAIWSGIQWLDEEIPTGSIPMWPFVLALSGLAFVASVGVAKRKEWSSRLLLAICWVVSLYSALFVGAWATTLRITPVSEYFEVYSPVHGMMLGLLGVVVFHAVLLLVTLTIWLILRRRDVRSLFRDQTSAEELK